MHASYELNCLKKQIGKRPRKRIASIERQVRHFVTLVCSYDRLQ
jgi:hypothetical protein